MAHPLIEYRKRIDAIKLVEDSKEKLIQDLFKEVECLSGLLREKDVLFGGERGSDTLYRQPLTDSNGKLHRVALDTLWPYSSARQRLTKFICVLVDGGCINFLDSLVQKGEDGGHEAVRLMKTAVCSHIHATYDEFPENLRILVRVFADTKRLARTYKEARILSDEKQFELFVRSFNMADPYCEFVDVNGEKESLDRRLEANLRLQMDNLHCQHLILGTLIGNGHVEVLDQCCLDDRDYERITLLVSPAPRNQLVRLQDRFKMISAPSVFREEMISSTKLSFRQPSLATTLATDRPYYAAESPSPHKPADPGNVAQPSQTQPVPSRIARNRSGQRIDLPLDISAHYIARIKKEKYCNSYHLTGSCSYATCSHKHGARLEGQSLKALQAAARLSPCPAGLSCKDEMCYMGHRCTRSSCALGGSCWFPRTMHGIDAKVVEHGTYEPS